MQLQHIKMTVSGSWILLSLVIAIVSNLSWISGVTLAAFGLLPPLAILLLWNDPAQTMSESIREGRRES